MQRPKQQHDDITFAYKVLLGIREYLNNLTLICQQHFTFANFNRILSLLHPETAATIHKMYIETSKIRITLYGNTAYQHLYNGFSMHILSAIKQIFVLNLEYVSKKLTAIVPTNDNISQLLIDIISFKNTFQLFIEYSWLNVNNEVVKDNLCKIYQACADKSSSTELKSFDIKKLAYKLLTLELAQIDAVLNDMQNNFALETAQPFSARPSI